MFDPMFDRMFANITQNISLTTNISRSANISMRPVLRRPLVQRRNPRSANLRFRVPEGGRSAIRGRRKGGVPGTAEKGPKRGL